MPSDNEYDWILHRTKTGFGDDTDYVDTQTAPPDGELVRMGNIRRVASGRPTPVAMLLYIDWLDASGNLVDPATGTGRGSFNADILRVLRRQKDAQSPSPATIDAVLDGKQISSGVGYRAYVIGDLGGESVWVRLNTIVAPAGGAPASLRVWLAPLERAQ